MDIEKAERVSELLSRVSFIKMVVDDMGTVLATSPVGKTTVTVPRTWLPGIIEIGRRELAELEEQIAKL